ncbi:hypothetical protein [Halotia branconii]|uniref:Uncharacterized protein n=1 Tax=Halotia branconii CENA392 TaxID=1539056 RepID=A0AAJ6NYK5_9CYAN|nr:hypothetical protein [Halotia branconii]WGV29032.1 hypothetical protein QI031_31225 [Halotia branconii CENA392]
MMIVTTLAPIQQAQSTDENSVASLRLAYIETRVDYQILEQQIRNTPIDQFNLLVQLNEKLVAAAQRMEAALAAWSDELDRLIGIPVELDLLPTPGLRLIDGWLHDSSGGRTLTLFCHSRQRKNRNKRY